MNFAIPKDTIVECREWLDWVRRQRCWACPPEARRRQSEAHHFPPKGMGGARLRDDMTIPLCREHHDDAQRYKIPAEVQAQWVAEVRSAFLDSASPQEIGAFIMAREEGRPRLLIPH